MAHSPDAITVTHDDLADDVEYFGRRLTYIAMALRAGFDVPVEYVAGAGRTSAGRIPPSADYITWTERRRLDADRLFAHRYGNPANRVWSVEGRRLNEADLLNRIGEASIIVLEEAK